MHNYNLKMILYSSLNDCYLEALRTINDKTVCTWLIYTSILRMLSFSLCLFQGKDAVSIYNIKFPERAMCCI